MIPFPLLKPVTAGAAGIFLDGFESGVNNWTEEVESGGTGGVSQSGAQKSAGNYSMFVEAVPAGYYTKAILNNLGVNTNVTIEFDIYIVSGYGNFAFYFQTFDSTGTYNQILLNAYGTTPDFRYHDGSSYNSFMTLSTDTWHTVKLVVDFSAGTYDIIVDTNLEVDNASFRQSANNIDELFFNVGGGSSNTGGIFIDEFKIY